MTPGQAAYEAWCQQVIPPVTMQWDDLPSDKARAGWEKIANAACSAAVAARTIPGLKWQQEWVHEGRDRDGNLELRHIETGGVYRLLPVEDLERC
jgi:hypothetical protein